MKRRKSNIVGILFPTSIGLLFAETLVAIQEKIQERQMPLIIGNSKYNMEEENRLMKQFLERSGAGIIFTGYGLGHGRLIKGLMAQI